MFLSYFPSMSGFNAKSEDVTPTHTVKDMLEISPVSGVNLVLYYAPGETEDQLIVWWPSERILFPADNITRVLKFRK